MAQKSKRFEKIGPTKIYEPNGLSITLDSDLSHQKMWNEKVEEAKFIQQQKQIDRMLTGIVKQRLFGHFLSQDSRISNEGYYQLEKVSKELFNPPKLKSHRRVTPLKNIKDFDIIPKFRKRTLHKTIDVSELPKVRKKESFSQKNSFEMDGSKQRNNNYIPKSFSIANYPDFSNHFRVLTNNFSSILYDIKLTKQMVFKYNRDKKIVNQSMLEKFMYFFNYPGTVNIKQLGKWIESVASCSMRESSFFIFQAFDQSHNGFLTISDLFRALHNLPDNPELQKQVYELMNMIQQIAEELKKMNIDVKEIKPTVEQLLVRNPELKLDSLKELLKQQSQDLVPGNCVKSTLYHKSLMALQHDPLTREKMSKIESTENENKKKKDENSQDDEKMKQDGLRLRDYAKQFETKRSKFFVSILEIFVGAHITEWE